MIYDLTEIIRVVFITVIEGFTRGTKMITGEVS